MYLFIQLLRRGWYLYREPSTAIVVSGRSNLSSNVAVPSTHTCNHVNRLTHPNFNSEGTCPFCSHSPLLTSLHLLENSISKVGKLSRYTPWRHLGKGGGIAPTHSWPRHWMEGLVVSIMPQPRFTPRKRTPGTHWKGGWVGPRASLDAGARRKILCTCRGSNPDHPARSQTLYCLSYPSSSVNNIFLQIMIITMTPMNIRKNRWEK
jgi:hypothetical protein